eukprot:TRINITY_DN9439_c0_g1_i7.p2 TRINITY_DN9439_c0_g1~~TRINITY_DN9439_c0_g1_i7.p2  ORF type:complete len:146 (+),score=48.32 TRINITY_DN9439_c0_g1_i7:116-553(+)
MLRSLVGSEMCIRDRSTQSTGGGTTPFAIHPRMAKPNAQAARKRRLGDDVDRVFGLLDSYLMAAEAEGKDVEVREVLGEGAREHAMEECEFPSEPENVSTNKRHKKVSMVVTMLKDRAFQKELEALSVRDKPLLEHDGEREPPEK